MQSLTRVFAIVALNIRNIPRRLASSIVTVIGVAAVVLVFAAVLSISRGFERTLTAAGADDTAIVMRTGATSEMNSGMSNEQALIVANAPGVLRLDDQPLVSAELYVVADVRKRSTQEEANVPFRGVEAAAFDVRKNIELVAGRMFETGKNELVVGRAAQREFMGLELGETISFGPTEWDIVGVFEANGGVSESELWTDVRVLQNIYRRGNSYQSVRVKLEREDAMDTFKAALESDPRIQADVMTERAYYASQAEGMTTFINYVGYPLAALMAIGAVFGALNSMYASVSARGKEIATLRALGFGPLPVMVSTIVESALLAVAGGVLGGSLAYVVFNGFQASTLSAGFSQVVFNFAVTGDLLVQGFVAALAIGLIGGFFPAIRAARLPVAKALREL
jgi:putative ABC transport system permease protein